jgi:hypothetical protein
MKVIIQVTYLVEYEDFIPDGLTQDQQREACSKIDVPYPESVDKLQWYMTSFQDKEGNEIWDVG